MWLRRQSRGTGLDLSTAHGHSEVGDERIFGLSGPMQDHEAPSGLPAQINGLDGLSDGTDLVVLDPHGVSGLFFHASGDEFRVRDVQVVTNYLDCAAQRRRVFTKAFPVVFRKAVFD